MIDIEQKYNIYDIGYNKFLMKEEETSLLDLLEEGLSNAFIEGGGGLSNFNLKISENAQIGDNLASNLAFLKDGVLTQDLINQALDTQAKQILEEFTFGSSGAIKIATDDDNGIWISPNGILGKKAGSTTFSLTSSGDATFKGEVLAGSIISCDISADRITTGTLTGINIDAVNISGSTITGGTIQTSTSGRRIVIDDVDDNIKFYDENGEYVGYLSGVTAAIRSDKDIVSEQRLALGLGYALRWGGVNVMSVFSSNTAQLRIYKHLAAYPTGELTIGTPDYKWKELYLSANAHIDGNIYVGGTVDGVDVSAFKSSFDTHKSTHFSSGGDLYIPTDIRDLHNLRFSSSYGGIYWGSDTVFYIGLPNSSSIQIYKHLLPNSASAALNLGSDTQYFNEINYKYLTDRGCLAWFDNGVELLNGKKVSDLEALKVIKPHPTKKTKHGVPQLDYKTLPKPVYRKPENPKGEEGAELTALISILIGAIKQLDKKVEALEAKIKQ